MPSSLPRPRGRSQNRSTAYLQWILTSWSLPHSKNAAIRAAARSSTHSSLLACRPSAWNPQAMATAYARGILIGASESLVNMQRFGSAIDPDLRFCIFAIFVLALYYFLGGSWGTLGMLCKALRAFLGCSCGSWDALGVSWNVVRRSWAFLV